MSRKYIVVYDGSMSFIDKAENANEHNRHSITDPLGFEVAKLHLLEYLRIHRDEFRFAIKEVYNMTTKDI